MTATPPRPPTRNDVAKLAGVSSAVVSYVVNDGPRPVSPETRQRVLNAIDKLGYRPNPVAKALISGRVDLIGFVVPSVSNPYFSQLAQHVEQQARERGIAVALGQGEKDDVASVLRSFIGHGVAGVVTCSRLTMPTLELTARQHLPVVYMSIPELPDGTAGVVPDYFAGAMGLTHHLIEVHGHRRLAMVMGQTSDRAPGWSDYRELGWRRALAEAGLPAGPTLQTDWSAAGGWRAANELVDLHPDVTGVVISSDLEATGFLAGLHDRGVVVPDEVAVVSFDGAPSSAYTVPPLTTAKASPAEMAARALHQLLDAVRERAVVKSELVIRRSCGCGGTQVTA